MMQMPMPPNMMASSTAPGAPAVIMPQQAPPPGQPQYQITEDDRTRQKRIANAIKAYDGDLEPPLNPVPGEPDDNVLTNRCKQIVDRGVEFLFGKELGITIEESAPQEAQKILDNIWGRKEKRITLLQKLAMNGAFSGEAFLRIVPSKNGKNLRLVNLDPATVFVQTAPQDCDTVQLYCIEYSQMQQVNGRPNQIYYREEIWRVDPTPDDPKGSEDTDADGLDDDVTWKIQHWSRIGDRGEWTPAGQPIDWPYPFAPIFSCQNLPRPNEAWGYPDIMPDLIGLNKALNLLLSDINRTEKIYGAPIVYATGTGEQIIDNKPGHIIGLPLSDSKIVAVNITSDVPSALQFSGDLRSDIDELTGVPGVATGRIADLPRGTLSGVAIELLFMPLGKKTDKKRCSYGELIIDVSKAILTMKNLSPDIDITLAWQNPLPSDDLQSVQGAVAKKQIGISDATLQRELGYDPDEEAELNASQDAQKVIAFSRGQGLAPNMTPPQQQAPGQSNQTNQTNQDQAQPAASMMQQQ